jgi:hypothetical protein
MKGNLEIEQHQQCKKEDRPEMHQGHPDTPRK